MANSPPTTHRITEFYQWYKGGMLELKPPYQRNPVWSPKNRSYLIDTILHDYPVPEIFMQIETTSEGAIKYSVVDGQQRIRAILDYIDGEYAILESESKSFGGKEFKDLPDGTKKDFWDFEIVTRELKTSNDDEVTMVFKRMNKYVIPLNPQEIRNATYRGQFIELVNHLTEDDYWSDNKIVSPNDIKRMLDAEFLSELLIALLHGIQTKDTDSIDGYYKMYDDNFSDEDIVKTQVKSTIKKLDAILEDLRPTRWHRKNEFYSLFLAVTQLLEEYLIPTERYREIKERLCDFSNELDKGRTHVVSSQATAFLETLAAHTTNKEERIKRTNIVRELIIPYLVAKDAKRDFTEEERRVAWGMSPDKKCAICNNVVGSWDDYHLDHIIPHSKGGLTELRNSQITHNSCNQSKSNK